MFNGIDSDPIRHDGTYPLQDQSGRFPGTLEISLRTDGPWFHANFIFAEEMSTLPLIYGIPGTGLFPTSDAAYEAAIENGFIPLGQTDTEG